MSRFDGWNVVRRVSVLAAIGVALLAVPTASSRPAAGIGVTVSPIVVLPYYTASIGTYYIVVTSARWSPPAIRTEGAIYIRSCSPESPLKRCTPSGSPSVKSFGYGGAVLHTSEAYGGLMGLFAGDRATITARWRVYNPTPAGFIDGVGESKAYELTVPEGLPPRFKDVTKLTFADLGVTMYAECASVSVLGGAGTIPGFGAVGGVYAGDSCAAADGQMDLSFDPVDLRFRSIVKPAIPKAAKVAAAGQLTAQAASSFNALFAARAKEIGYQRAVVTSVNRAQGAYVKKQRQWEEKQMRAAGRYASALASAFDDELRARGALAKQLQAVAGATGVTDENVSEFVDGVIRTGLPSDLAARLTRLGLTKAEQALVRGWMLATDPGRVTGNPYARMNHPWTMRYLRLTSAALKEFSKKAARAPLETST